MAGGSAQYGFDGRKGSGNSAISFQPMPPSSWPPRLTMELPRPIRLAIVPYGDGEVTLKRTRGASAQVTEHYFQGGKASKQAAIANGEMRIPLRETTDEGAIVEWVEVAVS